MIIYNKNITKYHYKFKLLMSIVYGDVNIEYNKYNTDEHNIFIDMYLLGWPVCVWIKNNKMINNNQIEPEIVKKIVKYIIYYITLDQQNICLILENNTIYWNHNDLFNININKNIFKVNEMNVFNLFKKINNILTIDKDSIEFKYNHIYYKMNNDIMPYVLLRDKQLFIKNHLIYDVNTDKPILNLRPFIRNISIIKKKKYFHISINNYKVIEIKFMT